MARMSSSVLFFFSLFVVTYSCMCVNTWVPFIAFSQAISYSYNMYPTVTYSLGLLSTPL